jgi:hypothetical protein
MEHWRIKVEPEEQVDATKNAVKIKVEPEDGDLITSCIEIEEHPVKLEEDEGQHVMLNNGLPTDILGHGQPWNICKCSINIYILTIIFTSK